MTPFFCTSYFFLFTLQSLFTESESEIQIIPIESDDFVVVDDNDGKRRATAIFQKLSPAERQKKKSTFFLDVLCDFLLRIS